MNITEKLKKLETDFDKDAYDRALSELRGLGDRIALCQKRLTDKRGHLDMRGVSLNEEDVYQQLEMTEKHVEGSTDLAFPYWADTYLSQCERWVKNNIDHIASLHKHWQDKHSFCGIP